MKYKGFCRWGDCGGGKFGLQKLLKRNKTKLGRVGLRLKYRSDNISA